MSTCSDLTAGKVNLVVHKSLFIPQYSIATFDTQKEEVVKGFRLVHGIIACKLKRGNTKARRLLVSGSQAAVEEVMLRAQELIHSDRLLYQMQTCIEAVCMELLLTVTMIV